MIPFSIQVSMGNLNDKHDAVAAIRFLIRIVVFHLAKAASRFAVLAQQRATMRCIGPVNVRQLVVRG